MNDTFDKQPAAKFVPAMTYDRDHPLSPAQVSYQNVVKHIWDEERRADVEYRRRVFGDAGPLSKEETFPAIMNARLSIVHPACPDANYGDAGEEDLVAGPGGPTQEEVDDLAFDVDQRNAPEPVEDPPRRKKSKENREAFRRKMETEWPSYRMEALLKVIAVQLKKRPDGKFIIFSEFLCVLDVVHAALDAHGYGERILRYDGWTSTADKERAVELFQDPNSGYDFFLVTNRSGGEGINLQAATTVAHITPCWSFAMTYQCNSRAIRSGQPNEVEVFYFCIKDSIEGYMAQLARTKAKKASMLLDPDEGTNAIMGKIPTWTMAEFMELVSRLTQPSVVLLTESR